MLPSRLLKLLIFGGVALLLFIGLQPVQAHAILERSDPPDNVTLAEAPRVVRLWFSEPVAIKFSSVNLLDPTGSQVSGVTLTQDPGDQRLLRVNLPPLGKGLYSLAWQILSAADGHETAGLLVFGVGIAPLDQASASEAPLQPPAQTLALSRALTDLTCCALFGALFISLGLLFPKKIDPHLEAEYEQARRRATAWSLALAVLAFLSGILQLANQLAEVSSRTGWVDLLFGTNWGRNWLLHTWLLFIIVLLIWRTRWVLAEETSRMVWIGTVFLSGVVLATQAFSSHASGLVQPVIPLLANLAHLLSAGVWTGGLAVLLITARLRPRARPGAENFSRILWAGFGRFAAVSAGIVFATGLYNSSLMVASSGALRSSLYGTYLVIKIGLVCLVCLAGLINSLSLHPRLSLPLLRFLGVARAPSPRVTPLTIGLEAAFGLGVFLLAGYLGSTSPANGIGYRYTGVTQEKSISRQVNDLVMTLAVQPNLPGQNFIQLQTVSVRRPPPAEIARVIFHLTYQDDDLGTQNIDGLQVKPGVYRLSGGYMSLPGPWKIEVVIRRLGLPDTVSDFDWNVLPLGSGPGNFSLQSPLLFLSGVTLLLTCILAGWVMFTRRSRQDAG
jgi:copper transport protein